jgi:hypothetical protein
MRVALVHHLTGFFVNSELGEASVTRIKKSYGERPRHRRAAEKRDKLASFQIIFA